MKTPPASDAALAEAIRAGDPAALDALIYRHRGMVIRIARQFCTSTRIDRLDLQQAGFVTLQKCARSFDPERGRFSTYAYRAVRNEIAAVARRELRSNAPVDPLVPLDDGGLLASIPSPESPEQFDPTPVHGALSKLPPMHRAALEVRFGINRDTPLQTPEAAASLGLSVHKLHEIFTEAVQMLKASLPSR